MTMQDILNAAFSREADADIRAQNRPTIAPANPPPLPPPTMPNPPEESSQPNMAALALSLLGQQGAGAHGYGAGPGVGGYSNGDVPNGRGIFFNNDVDVLQPNDPRLVTRYGITLARPAMRSLVDIFGNRNVDLGGGYRSPQGQADIYARKPGVAAAPGHSYHQEGLAIDLAAAFQKARWERLLAQAGWNRFSPGGEPWHWSYGVTG